MTEETKLKVEAIKTTDGFFIKNCRDLIFSKQKPEKTWHPDWYKVQSMANVEKIVPEVRTVTGYALKPEFAPTEAMPAHVDVNFFGECQFEWQKYDHRMYSFYDPEEDIVPETSEPVDVDIEIIAEVDGELVESKIHFPVYGRYPNTDGKNWSVTNSRLKLGLLDQIITPDILRQERPCELSSEDSYKIIRTHIKDNIDPRVAEITSDYEFCLTVKKRIPLCKPESYKVDVNSSLFGGRKRKPKIVTRYRNFRNREVYAVAPSLKGEVYQGYPEAPIFRGENARNLQANIDAYLEDIMELINKPLKDCPTCNGEGVLPYAPEVTTE